MIKLVTEQPDRLKTVSLSYYKDLGLFEGSVARSAVPIYGVYLDRTDRSPEVAIVTACLDALEGE